MKFPWIVDSLWISRKRLAFQAFVLRSWAAAES